MPTAQYKQLTWQETKNDITIDCSLDIAVHPAQSRVIFVTIPGVDGSVDGYQNKYVDIANSVQQKHEVAVVRAANPFITSFHWESNIRELLMYIEDNAKSICGTAKPELYVMAHSAGAAIVARIAWEYPEIKRLLLVNPASKLGIEHMLQGVSKFEGQSVTIVYGEHDPSVESSKDFEGIKTVANVVVEILPGIDHDFSGKEGLEKFKLLPSLHLFRD